MCSSPDGPGHRGGTLNLYSARHYKTDEALYGNFADLTGVKINRVDAEPDPLIQRLRTEGDKSASVCDVFITVDAGRIERAREMGLLQATDSAVLAKAIPAYLRDPDNTWFGFSKRARVIVFNKEKMQAAAAPQNYEDLADPKWKGKVPHPLLGQYLQSVAHRIDPRGRWSGED